MITDSVFIDLLRETGAKTVVWTALYEPWIADRDRNLKSKLESRGIKVCSLNSSLILKKVFEKTLFFFSFFKVHVEHSYLLHIPDEVALSNAQQGIGSVTHFMECCKNGTGSRSPIGTPVGKQIKVHIF